MKRKLLLVSLVCLLVSSLVLVSCAEETTPTPTSKTPTPAAATPTPTVEANWWDELGEPQYGGELVQAIGRLGYQYDTINFLGADNSLWFVAPLFEVDSTLDPEKYPVSFDFVQQKYYVGHSAESWELTDQQTITVNLRKGITWQDKPPVNGREFTAYDVAASMQRKMSPESTYAGTMSVFESVTATDEYTVVFKFKEPCGSMALYSILDVSKHFEAPEWVALSLEERQDWHNAVGAGPWMLADYVDGASMTYSRNPTYWGSDPRHPENKTPYVDTLKTICIPDDSTRLAALRTGKVDVLPNVEWQQTQTLESTNPELVRGTPAVDTAPGVVFRHDKAPFTDIRVRKAMNMAIDRQAIAETLFGGYSTGEPSGLVFQDYEGWCFAYEDWPQALKDEYAYNPEKARQLLAEAAADNVFEVNEHGGFDTNVVLAIGNPICTGVTVELLEAFKGYFKDIGIDMEIKTMESTAGGTFLRSGKHDQMAGVVGGYTFNPTRTIEEFCSNGPSVPIYGVNDSVYDAVRDKFISAKTEEEAAQAMMEADQRVIEQHWAIWMEGAGNFYFTQPYVKGYNRRVEMDWVGWARCWVDQSLKK